MYQKKKISFIYNLIKGKIAEQLVEQLFKDLGFDVYRCGIESNIPNHQRLLRELGEENAKSLKIIRDFPDYTVVCERTKTAFTIDVKYRAYGKLELTSFKDYNYKNVIFLIINSDFMGIVNSDEVIEKAKNKEFQEIENFEKFENAQVFNFDSSQKKTIRQYQKLAEHFFSKLPDNRTVIQEVYSIKEPKILYITDELQAKTGDDT